MRKMQKKFVGGGIISIFAPQVGNAFVGQYALGRIVFLCPLGYY